MSVHRTTLLSFFLNVSVLRATLLRFLNVCSPDNIVIFFNVQICLANCDSTIMHSGNVISMQVFFLLMISFDELSSRYIF